MLPLSVIVYNRHVAQAVGFIALSFVVRTFFFEHVLIGGMSVGHKNSHSRAFWTCLYCFVFRHEECNVHASRSSGVLSGVTWADGLVVIAENRLISKGDPVQFIPFSELLT